MNAGAGLRTVPGTALAAPIFPPQSHPPSPPPPPAGVVLYSADHQHIAREREASLEMQLQMTANRCPASARARRTAGEAHCPQPTPTPPRHTAADRLGRCSGGFGCFRFGCVSAGLPTGGFLLCSCGLRCTFPATHMPVPSEGVAFLWCAHGNGIDLSRADRGNCSEPPGSRLLSGADAGV